MAYAELSRYNGFRNRSKDMGGKMARCVSVWIHPIGGLGVSEGVRIEDGDPIFGRKIS